MKKAFVFILLVGLYLPAAQPQTTSAAAPPPAPAPGNAFEPASSGGIVALDRLLQRLAIHKRMLVIAAHPDDEDNRLLTLASRKMSAEVAYQSVQLG